MTPIRIIIFAKAPLPGFAKTRLIPALGAEGAARLAQRMLRHTVSEALAADAGEVELCVSPDPTSPQWLAFHDATWNVGWHAQGEGDLGERLARATRRATASGRRVLLIGTDCPGLTARHLRMAASELRNHDAVIAPSLDGGYVLLGLQQFHASIFQGVAWSTDSVAHETLFRVDKLGWSVARLPMLRDIDEPDDLRFLPEMFREAPACRM